jgi:hypothetical protein
VRLKNQLRLSGPYAAPKPPEMLARFRVSDLETAGFSSFSAGGGHS